MPRTMTLASLLLATLLTAGCEREGPAERAGKAIDEAAQSLGDGGNDLGNAIEDACEELKEGAGAKDTDC